MARRRHNFWWRSLGRLFSALSAGRPLYMPRGDLKSFDSLVYAQEQ